MARGISTRGASRMISEPRDLRNRLPGFASLGGEASAPWTRSTTQIGAACSASRTTRRPAGAPGPACLLLTGPDGTWGRRDQRRAALLRVPGGTERPARASVAAGVRPGDTSRLIPGDVPLPGAGAGRGRPRRSFRSGACSRVRLHRGPDVPPRRGAPERPRRQFLRRRRREHSRVSRTTHSPRGGVRRVTMIPRGPAGRRIGDGVGSIRRDGRDRPRRPGTARSARIYPIAPGAADETVTVEWGISSNAGNVATVPTTRGWA